MSSSVHIDHMYAHVCTNQAVKMVRKWVLINLTGSSPSNERPNKVLLARSTKILHVLVLNSYTPLRARILIASYKTQLFASVNDQNNYLWSAIVCDPIKIVFLENADIRRKTLIVLVIVALSRRSHCFFQRLYAVEGSLYWVYTATVFRPFYVPTRLPLNYKNRSDNAVFLDTRTHWSWSHDDRRVAASLLKSK